MPQNEYIVMDDIGSPYGSEPVSKKPVLLLGADPEVFVKNKSQGRVVPSCDVVGGTKSKGIPFGPKKDRMTILEDNVAVEFNFAPAHSYETFVGRVQEVWTHGTKYLADRGLEPYPVALYKFDKKDLHSDKANIFGCDPDFCAYEAEGVEQDDDDGRIVDVGSVGEQRFCGGHLHFGFENKEKVPGYAMAILADLTIGLTSVKYDKQGARRQYYGLAGLYRKKPYGFEYRTMSNWWLRPENVTHMSYMALECFSLMHYMANSVLELGMVYDKMPIKDVQTAINSEDDTDCSNLRNQFRRYCAEQGLNLGSYFK
jgi:hypothetical protein